MVIKIQRNALKVLCREFMHLLPVRPSTPLRMTGSTPGERVAVGMKCTVESEGYGQIGVVECTGVFEVHVYELSDSVMAMADGDTGSKGLLYKDGCNDRTKVQVCRFRFVRRNDVTVTALLDGELPKIGVEVRRQGTLSL